jgi:hypothetical protein
MGYIDGIHVTIAAPWIVWVGGVFPLGFTSRNPWGFVMIIELDGKIGTGKPFFLMVKTMVSGEDFPANPLIYLFFMGFQL